MKSNILYDVIDDCKFPLVPLSFITNYTSGWTPPSNVSSFYNGENKWATISDLGEKYIDSTKNHISDLAVEDKKNAEMSQPGDLLFSFKLSVGSVSIVKEPMFTNEAIATFKPSEKLDIRYAYYAFPIFIPANARPNIYGAPLLNADLISRARIPLIDLETQHRIADYLDKEIGKIDELIKDLKELIKNLEERKKALVNEVFSKNKEKYGNSKVWINSNLIRRGISPFYTEGKGIKVINQKCVRPNREIDYGLCRFHDQKEKEVSSHLFLQKGDILINSTGTGTLGRSSIIKENLEEKITFDSHVTLIRPNNKINPSYLSWVIYNEEQKLIDFSVGSTNQIELSRPMVANIEFPFPPIEKQIEIAKELDEEFENMDSLIDNCSKLIELLKERKAVLITEVVTGRLKV